MRRPAPPLFLAIFGLVLVTLLVSQLVAAGLLVLVRPPGPQALSLPAVAQEVSGAPVKLRQVELARAPTRAQTPNEARLAADVAARLGLSADAVHLSLARMQRDRYIMVDLGTAAAPDVQPMLVGDFTLAVRGTDGRWRAYSLRGEGVFDTVEKRYVLLFLLGALVMLPVAWWVARVLAKPFGQIATTARRVGQDPATPVAIVAAPLEARLASEALAVMAKRLAAHLAERTAMVGALAHDFRTPLTRLAFRVEALPAEVAGPMMGDVRELDEMVSATLAYVRGVSLVGEKQRIELASLVETVAEEVGGPIAFGRCDPVLVDGDPVALKRLFANLLRNAVTYGERASVTIQKRDSMAVVEIADRGPGLPRADLVRVFEPFFRAEPSRNRNRGGMGLGMPIAAAVARAHGGSVTLRNLEPRGLRARVRLPLAAAGPAMPRPAAAGDARRPALSS